MISGRSIRTKLSIGFGVLLALGALNIAIQYWGAHERAEAFSELQRVVERQMQTAEVVNLLEDQKQYVDLLLGVVGVQQSAPPSEDEQRQFAESVDAIVARMRAVVDAAEPATADLIYLYETTEALANSWKRFYRLQGTNVSEAFGELYIHAEPLAEQLLTRAFPAQIKRDQQQAASAEAEFAYTDKVFRWVAWAGFVFSVLLGGLLAFLVSRDVLRSVAALKAGAEQVGAGALTYRVAVRSRDELGEVAMAFNEMAERLHERTAELDEKHRLLELEHARKSKELDETRQIQLSMLPSGIPDHPNADVRVYMHTATEIGGDYYDFDVAPDGSLTVAIGDATGHGARAGAMVTAMKILFVSLRHEKNVLDILRKATEPLKRAGLPRLYMAFAVGRLRQDTLELAGAGMPPALIYRAGEECVEEISLSGMPLGSFVDFPYRKVSVQVAPGDTVLLMSDGFAELFNEEGVMLGYDRAAAVLRKSAAKGPDEVIKQLRATAAAWVHRDGANGASRREDDMTFLAIRLKAAEEIQQHQRTRRSKAIRAARVV